MLRPLLIIGLGGAGGKTIRAMKQELERKFASAGYDGPIPSAWQFLQIDTAFDGSDFPAPMLEKDNFHQVVPNGQDFAGILQSITSKGDIVDQQKMLSGWGIPNSAVNINMGAGQTRAIGRLAGVADSVGISKAIQNSIAKMCGPTADIELVNLANALNLDNPIKDPQVFIVASVVGGSGAGMFMDVAELLKRATPGGWTKQAASILYTQDVFASVAFPHNQMAQNALGVLNELTAGRLVGLSEHSELLYQKLGIPPVAPDSYASIGCRVNFLIDNKLNLEMNEVFMTTAEALVATLISDDASDLLYNSMFYPYPKGEVVDLLGIATGNSFDNLSTTQASLPLWAHASITKPILKQVAQSKNHSQTWDQFWEGRRSRPLVEAIPFETEMRRSIITGWFIATFFGMRKIEDVPAGRTAKIWNPTLQTPGWSTFPSPLLPTHPEDARRGAWMLPAILTSAGIALCEFGETGDSEKIEAYKFLLYLGREVTTSIPNRDNWNLPGVGDELPTGESAMSKCLLNWVKNGTKPAELDLLEFLQFHIDTKYGAKHGAARQEAMKAAVNALREQYKNVWEEYGDSHWSQMPETWELKDDIDLAFDDIYNNVSAIRTGPTDCDLEGLQNGENNWGIEDPKTTKKSLFGRFKR